MTTTKHNFAIDSGVTVKKAVTTNPVTESPTQDLDNLEMEERYEVCSNAVQLCSEGRRCYGLVMRDGSVHYLCADSFPGNFVF